eukprot:scaffold3161_cov118-Isochrysis_galbana.AAC.18
MYKVLGCDLVISGRLYAYAVKSRPVVHRSTYWGGKYCVTCRVAIPSPQSRSATTDLASARPAAQSQVDLLREAPRVELRTAAQSCRAYA